MGKHEHFTNGRCLAFGTGLTLGIAAFGAQTSGWPHLVTIGLAYGIGLVLMVISTVAITRSIYAKRADSQIAAASNGKQQIIAGIPTISALLGQDPSASFDAKMFFATAHYSPITAEVENNMKIIARQCSPNDVEAFYARFIGVGLPVYLYEQAWVLIFNSQIAAMEEMNRLGLMPISDLKKHYDAASVRYPQTYATYSFDQWLNFLKEKMFVAAYPSQMIEITFLGRDFLKYLSHTGRDLHQKLN